MIEGLAVIFVLATLVEGFVEYFVAREGKDQPWLKYVAAGFGVLVCVLYNVDLLALFDVTSTIPFVGSVLTGLVIGRGSNYLNDLISRIRGGQSTTSS